MNTNMKNKTMNTKVVYRQSLRQRITATVMAIFMLAQICMPAVVAAEVLSNAQITSKVIADIQYQPSTTSDYLYQQASYLGQAIPIQNQTIDSFYKTLVKEKIGLLNPTFIPIAGDITFFIPTYPLGKLLGDNYVQNRFIRSQINDLLGRHLITPDRINDGKFITETDQINELYKNAHDFVVRTGGQYKFGDVLPFKSDQISQDMIWPEIHNINGENVLVPVVYLSQNTINTYGVKGHIISFLSGAEFQSIQLDKANLLSVRGDLIKAANDITLNGGSIVGTNSLNIFAGGTLSNLSGTISAVDNIKITAAQINSKTIVVPYAFKNGNGTRLGEIAGYSTENGSITLNAYNGDITFEGATATAFGTITFNASNNIIIKTQQTQSQSTGVDGHWTLTNSSLDAIGSKISAVDNIKLIAGGAIQISGSEIYSTKGGIELLAKQGIYILDDMGNTQVQKVDKIGKTQGTASDFNSWAIRSALDAGKGVLLYTEGGDVVLKGANINTVDGTQVTAKNGKVHLLLSKEQSQHYLDTVRKGMWTIKTTHVEEVVETGKPNAIIGGFAVEAMQGIDVEYTGKEGATLTDQIEEYRKIPSMAWIADLHDDKDGKLGANINWTQVDDVYKSIHKTKRNLSPAAMAIVAIAVCIAMGPAGATLAGGGTAAGATAASAAASVSTIASVGGAVMQAGIMTLTTAAAQSLAAGNSLGDTINAMDSDESLRSLAISMATAGAMQYTDIGFLSNAAKSENLAVSLTAQASQAVVNATVRAGISVVINGGNTDDFKNAFTQNLATSAINTLGEKMANKIGQLASGPTPKIGEAMRYIAHAGLGCALGVASGSAGNSDVDVGTNCASGAGGAVVGELLAQEYKESMMTPAEKDLVGWLESKGVYSEDRYNAMTDLEKSAFIKKVASSGVSSSEIATLRAKGIDIAKFGAGLAAFISKGNVSIASQTAENAATNNSFGLVAVLEIIVGGICAAIVIDEAYEGMKKYEEKYNAAVTQQEKDAVIIELAIAMGVSGAENLALSFTGTKLIEVVLKQAKAPWVRNTLKKFYEKETNTRYIDTDGEMVGQDIVMLENVWTTPKGLLEFIKENNIVLKDGWDADRLYKEVLSKPKGERPSPSDYLPAEYIASQLKQFESGVVRIASREKVTKEGLFYSGDEGFCIPKSEWDRLYQETGGDLAAISKKLGRNKNLDSSNDMILYFEKKNVADLKLASGNESPGNPNYGANQLWVPGAKTVNGVTEAVFVAPKGTPFSEIKF